jgi:hypothetical protein
MSPFPNLPPSALPLGPQSRATRSNVTDPATGWVQREQPEQDDTLLKLTGLFPCQSGNALLGGMDPNRVPRGGGGETIGALLIEKIQRAMELNRPLRFCVFENNGKFPDQRAPYTIHAAVGRPRQDLRQGSGSSPAQEESPRVDPPTQAVRGTQEAQFDTRLMAPLPPRPVRRTAPRR